MKSEFSCGGFVNMIICASCGKANEDGCKFCMNCGSPLPIVAGKNDASVNAPAPAPEPVIADPVMPAPVIADPVMPAPVIADPVMPDPVIADPVMPAPVISDPVMPAPVAAAPIAAVPVMASPDPVIADPVIPEPVPAAPAPVTAYPEPAVAPVAAPLAPEPAAVAEPVAAPVMPEPIIKPEPVFQPQPQVQPQAQPRPAYQASPAPAQGQDKTSGLSIAALITSILSVLTCGFLSPVSLILSIIGIVHVKKTKKKGFGMSIAGTIISALMLAFIITSLILAFVVIPKKVYDQMIEMGYRDEAKIFAEWVGISTKKSDSGDSDVISSNGREWWN